jgi:hypothetical protein
MSPNLTETALTPGPSPRGGGEERRRGMTLMELAVAGTLLGTLLVVCLQLLQATAAQRRTADQRQLALFELGNVLERLSARPWAELTPKSVAGEKPSAWLGNRLPGAELKIEVTTPASEPSAKRIVVSLRWQQRGGRYLPPVKITTWRFARKADSNPLEPRKTDFNPFPSGKTDSNPLKRNSPDTTKTE